MFEPIYKPRFKKELKLAEKRGKNMENMKEVVRLLLAGQPLLPKHHNHKLKGEFAGLWECHVDPDWLLIYEKTSTEVIFIRTGTHSDLF